MIEVCTIDSFSARSQRPVKRPEISFSEFFYKPQEQYDQNASA